MLGSAVIALLLAAPAAAGLPQAGKLVPGRSLGGIRLGQSPRAVRAALGTFYGSCRSCERQTWYFTYRPFDKQGLESQPGTPAELAAYMKREYDTWGKVVKDAGIKGQ